MSCCKEVIYQKYLISRRTLTHGSARCPHALLSNFLTISNRGLLLYWEHAVPSSRATAYTHRAHCHLMQKYRTHHRPAWILSILSHRFSNDTRMLGWSTGGCRRKKFLIYFAYFYASTHFLSALLGKIRPSRIRNKSNFWKKVFFGWSYDGKKKNRILRIQYMATWCDGTFYVNMTSSEVTYTSSYT